MNKEKIVELTKSIIGLGSEIGVSVIASAIIAAYTPVDLGKFKRICVALGGGAITGAMCKAAKKQVDNTIDDVVDLYDVVTGNKVNAN